MAKNIVGFAKTKEFEPVLDDLEELCKDKPYNKSEIMRRGVALLVEILKSPSEKQTQIERALKKAGIQKMFYEPNSLA